MKILFLASIGDFHVDVWTKYFTKNNLVYLFCEKGTHLKEQDYKNVVKIKSNGVLGWFLNKLELKSHFLFQLNKLISVKIFAKEILKIIKEYEIQIIHAHSLYYGFLSSNIKTNIPIIFTPMGSDILINANRSYIYKYMALRAYEKADIVTGDSLLKQKQGYLFGANKLHNYIIQNGVMKNIFYPKKIILKKIII